MQQVEFLRHASHHIFCQIKGPCTIFLVYLHFLITFSGWFRHNYITLYTLWKIEICSIQIWQNHIKKCKWGRIRAIRVWKIWGLLKELFSSSYWKYFWKASTSMDGSYYCLTRFRPKHFSIACFIHRFFIWEFFL